MSNKVAPADSFDGELNLAAMDDLERRSSGEDTPSKKYTKFHANIIKEEETFDNKGEDDIIDHRRPTFFHRPSDAPHKHFYVRHRCAHTSWIRCGPLFVQSPAPAISPPDGYTQSPDCCTCDRAMHVYCVSCFWRLSGVLKRASHKCRPCHVPRAEPTCGAGLWGLTSAAVDFLMPSHAPLLLSFTMHRLFFVNVLCCRGVVSAHSFLP